MWANKIKCQFFLWSQFFHKWAKNFEVFYQKWKIERKMSKKKEITGLKTWDGQTMNERISLSFNLNFIWSADFELQLSSIKYRDQRVNMNFSDWLCLLEMKFHRFLFTFHYKAKNDWHCLVFVIYLLWRK